MTPQLSDVITSVTCVVMMVVACEKVDPVIQTSPCVWALHVFHHAQPDPNLRPFDVRVTYIISSNVLHCVVWRVLQLSCPLRLSRKKPSIQRTHIRAAGCGLSLIVLFPPRQPIVTGTSVLALKYVDGVMLAADTLGSYGRLTRFTDLRRLRKCGDNTIVGAGGEYSDFQHIMELLEDLRFVGGACLCIRHLY